MFEGVRQAGEAGAFIAGADPIPQLADYHRGTVILAHDDLEAILQLELMGGLGTAGQAQAADQAEQAAGKGAVDKVGHGKAFLFGKRTLRLATLRTSLAKSA
ncbi:hypothetical protein GCM10007363_05900 [Pseudomonas fluvialis]|uniref:Uncharacterized protein n=1 Tax=Pseudomonas fluvialis TaxID=1793966 RepID=A0ABQ2ADD1_9PSED|nr:hypothetical protein GCM10007363_05900 [Pseudomonas fluvialis]